MLTPVSEEGPAPIGRELLGDDGPGRLARYWYDLADRAGGVPPRASFDPSRIIDLLPRLIVVEHLGDQDFRYRLMGTEVDQFTKARYTGMRTSEIDGHGPGNRIHALYVATLACECPIGMALPYVGRSTVCTSVRQLAVPFRPGDAPDDAPDQVISLIEFVLKPNVVLRLLAASDRRLL